MVPVFSQGSLGEDFNPGLVFIADGVYVYEGYIRLGDEPEVLRVNSLVVITDEGILVADGQPSAEGGEEMLAAIREVSDQPVRFLVNCSPHGDHSGSNSFFGDALVLSHVAARQAMEDSRKYFTERQVEFRLPDTVYTDRLTLHLGGRRIELRYFGPGHTEGDTVVYLPDEGVAFLSELYFNGAFASLAEGHADEHLETLNTIMSLDAEWYIPGHGIVRGENSDQLRKGVQRYYENVRAVRDVVRKHVKDGDSLETTMEQVDQELGEFSRIPFYRYLKERTITGVYRSLSAQVSAE